MTVAVLFVVYFILVGSDFSPSLVKAYISNYRTHMKCVFQLITKCLSVLKHPDLEVLTFNFHTTVDGSL